MKKTAFIVIIVLFLLLFLEFALRMAGIGDTYAERTQGKFISYYNQHLPSWYHTWTPNYPIVYNQPEIKCAFPANRLGLREVDLPNYRPEGKNRLMVIGDSFVEGDGVEYQYSMPRFLEKKLDSVQLNYQVYNAGCSGSDPFYEYMLLRDKLLPLHPTHVIMVINASDIGDVITRGGMERFQKNGTTLYKKANWLLPYYKRSHVVRLVCYLLGIDETLLAFGQKKKAVAKAISEIYQCVQQTKELCDSNNIKFVAVLQPCPSDLISENQDISGIHNITQMDMAKVNMIDIFSDFEGTINADNYLEYSWKINGHYNAKGYQFFAYILYKAIDREYPDFWKNTPK